MRTSFKEPLARQSFQQATKGTIATEESAKAHPIPEKNEKHILKYEILINNDHEGEYSTVI